jgi:hypothetical protein
MFSVQFAGRQKAGVYRFVTKSIFSDAFSQKHHASPAIALAASFFRSAKMQIFPHGFESRFSVAQVERNFLVINNERVHVFFVYGLLSTNNITKHRKKEEPDKTKRLTFFGNYVLFETVLKYLYLDFFKEKSMFLQPKRRRTNDRQIA